MSTQQNLTEEVFGSIAPILPVRSMEGARRFYTSMGFRFEAYQEGNEYAFLERGGLQLHLRLETHLTPEKNPSGVYLYLQQGQALRLETEFRGAGVSILSPLEDREWNMREFMVSDPDGNLLRFGEPVPRKESAQL